MSVTLIPALGIICPYLLWLLCSYLIINFTLSDLHLEFSCQFNLFLDNLIYFPNKTDNCQIGDLLSEFKYKTVLSALAAQVDLTEILIVILIARSSTQYQLCTTETKMSNLYRLASFIFFLMCSLFQIKTDLNNFLWALMGIKKWLQLISNVFKYLRKNCFCKCFCDF